MGQSEGDSRKDPLYSDLKAWIAYTPIFFTQAYALRLIWNRLPHPGWIATGTALFIIGFALRVWSIRTLGRFFTMELGIRKDHALVEKGPYRLIRHPSYTGYLLMLIGIGVAYRSWLAFGIPVGLTIGFLVLRIRQEERLLTQTLGSEYNEYRKRTFRLIPYLF
jgi:protein-S-isoprenylcysteine O-methyltransferase Ste14